MDLVLDVDAGGHPSVVPEMTTELRWFAHQPMPAVVVAWFTHGGAHGVIEHRTDTYLVDDRSDLGVKWRSGRTLELKVRAGAGRRFVLTDALSGDLEEWRRWSPADDLVALADTDRWVDVHKVVVKRRFTAAGDEVPWTNAAIPTDESGCDVEVAAVELGDSDLWTLAFAAFGPRAQRTGALTAAWRALTAGDPIPPEVEQGLTRACGYPEWLAEAAQPTPIPTADPESTPPAPAEGSPSILT